MADFTVYKSLELPKSNEKYSVSVANKNSMVIDSELHKLEIKNQSQDELLATKEALDSKLSTHNTSDSSHGDMRLLISGLAADKVDKISGKGLSTNDFTNEKNEKLEGIASGANKTSITNNLTATVAGTALDAVQGKALDDKGAQMSVYKGADGSLHFRDWTGADTVIPFSKASGFSITTIKLVLYTRNIWNGGEYSLSNIIFDVSRQNNVSVQNISFSIAGGHTASVIYKTDDGKSGTLSNNTIIDVSNSTTLQFELRCSNSGIKTGTTTATINNVQFN